MNIRMKMLRKIALVVDTDVFYKQSEKFGKLAARSLTSERRSQITGLENLANTSRKVSDILDYVKVRTARDLQSRKNDQPGWHRNDLGKEALAYLEQDLRKLRDDLCRSKELASLDEFQQQEVYMLLIRAFVSQLAAHYEYACQVGSGK